jgi:branched-chain amino acid transport system permease protein
MLTIYKVGEQDRPIVEEFNKKPIGHHSPELQRVLNVFRGASTQEKYVLICTKPHQEWVLGQLTGERGKPVKILKGKVFTKIEDAEREVFRRRWKKYTGGELDENVKRKA